MATKKSLLEPIKNELKPSKLNMNTPQPNLSEDQPKKSGGCCMGSTPCAPPAQNTLFKPNATKPATETPSKTPKTRVVIKYDVGYNNSLSLRGKGANLSWDKGLLLKNVSANEWVWETDTLFTTGEFKVLINDTQYELGANHTLTCGANIQYIPRF